MFHSSLYSRFNTHDISDCGTSFLLKFSKYLAENVCGGNISLSVCPLLTFLYWHFWSCHLSESLTFKITVPLTHGENRIRDLEVFPLETVWLRSWRCDSLRKNACCGNKRTQDQIHSTYAKTRNDAHASKPSTGEAESGPSPELMNQSLPKKVNASFTLIPCFKNVRWKAVEEDTQRPWPLYMIIHRLIYLYTCVY